MSEPLQKSRSAPFRDTSSPVDDEVLDEASLVVAARLERQNNPRVVPDIADLAAIRQVSGDNLVTIEADPDNRHLGAAVAFQGDKVRERRRLQYRPNVLRDRAHTQRYRYRGKGLKTVIRSCRRVLDSPSTSKPAKSRARPPNSAATNCERGRAYEASRILADSETRASMQEENECPYSRSAFSGPIFRASRLNKRREPPARVGAPAR
jgi:hypothetical protein